jgi:hypothetical protein
VRLPHTNASPSSIRELERVTLRGRRSANTDSFNLHTQSLSALGVHSFFE